MVGFSHGLTNRRERVDFSLNLIEFLEMMHRLNAMRMQWYFFLLEGEYDRCPSIICVYNDNRSGKKPFRFFNMWITDLGFMEIVRDQWGRQVHGCLMYSVTQKLKSMKEDLKKLNKEGFYDVNARAAQAYHKFMHLQDLMHSNATNVEVCKE